MREVKKNTQNTKCGFSIRTQLKIHFDLNGRSVDMTSDNYKF